MRALLLSCLFAAGPAFGLELTFRESYDLNRPASLEFDPDFCGLWIANEGPDLVLVTLDGLELRRLRSALPRIKAMGLIGNRMLLADGYGNFQWTDRNGTLEGRPFRMRGLLDTEGITFLPDGHFLTVEDEPGHLLWVSPEGEVVRRVDGLALSPRMTEPQGVARDPRSGHILVVDDWEGLNSLFEFDAEGRLLSTTPLHPYGRDPEGIALRAATNTLFIAFDGGAKIAAFDYQPSPGGVPDSNLSPMDCVIG